MSLHVFLEYKGFVFEQPLRLDILIDEVLIVELKAVEKVADPQSPTFELHETTQPALGPSHQFSRTRSEKRDLSDDSQRW
jgi:PD-(D/E)XK nuclease superfamily